MITKSVERHLPINKDLKRTFENAVRDIYEVEVTGKSSRYRTPIVQRTKVRAGESYLAAEKRALTDAAKALAQLWNVAPSSSR